MAATGCLLLTLLLTALLRGGIGAAPTPPGSAGTGGRARAFLAEQLPLRVVLTAPPELAAAPAGQALTLAGRQAITVVFSRPVIALGSDFGNGSAAGKFPFRLSCAALPGRGRWVTTSIARWEPAGAWPPDTDCSLAWERGLTAYDGAVLDLGAVPPTRRLATGPLALRLAGVTSELAANLTDGLWDALLGAPPDARPEVPPDGRLVLSPSHPVHLASLQRALELYEGGPRQGRAMRVVVRPCQCPAAGPWGQPEVPGGGGCVPAANACAPPPPSLDVNATCAEVVPAGELKQGTSYSLLLPRGARYHALSGPLAQDVALPLAGLRAFRLASPDRALGPGPEAASAERVYSPLRYRRLDLWLPHGLSPATPTAALAARMRLCRLPPAASPGTPCPAPGGGGGQGDSVDSGDLRFDLSRVSRGRLRLAAAGLQPGGRYRLEVAADAAVVDGFGLALQASSTDFVMDSISHVFTPPHSSSSHLIVLEAGSETLTEWPYLAHPMPPPPPQQAGGGGGYGHVSTYDNVSAWAPDVRKPGVVQTLLAVLSGYIYDTNMEDLLGPPTTTVPVPAELRTAPAAGAAGAAGAGWRELRMPLPGGTAGGAQEVHVLHTCCAKTYNGVAVSENVQVLLNSSLSVSAVQAGGQLAVWVMEGAAGGGPVAGASVGVYRVDPAWSGGRPNVTLLASCTTDVHGLCNVTALAAGEAESGRGLSVAVTAGPGRLALLPSAGWLPMPPAPPPYTASLVLDRAAVAPGDSIKVTGFVQGIAPPASPSAPLVFELPSEGPAVLEVSPPWGPTQAGGPDGVGATMGGAASSGAASSSGASSGAAAAVTRGSAAAQQQPPTRAIVVLNGSTGTLHAVLPIPAAARLQPYTLSLRLPPRPELQPAKAAAAATATGSSAAAAAAAGTSTAAVLPARGGRRLAAADRQQHASHGSLVVAQHSNEDDARLPRHAAAAASRGRTLAQAAAAPPPPPAPRPHTITPIFLMPPIPARSARKSPPPSPPAEAAEPPVLELDFSTSPPPRPPPRPKAGASAAVAPADYDKWPVVASVAFTVADPRPPTGDLKIKAPAWVRPNATVNVSLTAVSYIGASVGGARITLTWSYTGGSGVREVVTDAAGAAAMALDLRAVLGCGAVAAARLSLRAEWVGPTRERITREASVIIADGPATLALELSLDSPAPGAAFAVSAALTSNEDGSEIKGVPVAVTLTPLPNNASGGAEPPPCIERATCSATSGAGFEQLCQLSLPCVGKFRLEACADVAAPGSAARTRVCANTTLGRNASEWAAAPWAAHPNPVLKADKDAYALGEEVTLSLQTAWRHSRLLLVWGNERGVRSKVVMQASLRGGGLSRVALPPLGDECAGGCSLLALLDVPRLTPDEAYPLGAPPALPTSALFDPLAPHTHTMRIPLAIKPTNELRVAVAAVAAAAAGPAAGAAAGAEVVVEPGGTAQITVTVATPGAVGRPVAGAEVTVYGVDAAWLALLPYDLPKPQYDMLLRLPADVAAYGMDAYRLAPGAVRAVYDRLMTRLTGQDPWLPADTYVGPPRDGGWPRAPETTAAVDVNDTAYLALHASDLTYMPATRYGRMGFGGRGGGAFDGLMVADVAMASNAAGMEMSFAAKSVSSGVVPPQQVAAAAADMGGKLSSASATAARSAGGAAASPAAPRAPPRSAADFVVTPLFKVATTRPDGRAVVNFTAPPNLGTFFIRAFAADGDGARYGAGETRVVVRRRLSLTAALPRFVRVGDTFQAGVVVTAGAAPAEVAVTLKLAAPRVGPLRLPAAEAAAEGIATADVGTQTKRVVFAAGGDLQEEVRFSFAAAAVGTARLAFSAAEAGSGGGSDSLEVELPVQGQQGAVWIATSFALAAADPARSGGAGAEWQEGMALPAAVPGSGNLTLTAGVGHYPAIAATYDELERTQADRTYADAQPALLWATLPALLASYSQPPSTAHRAAVLSAAADLTSLTHPALGLLRTDPARFAGWAPQRVDVELNAWALFLTGLHEEALAAGGAGGAQAGVPQPELLLSGALAALAPGWGGVSGGLAPVWRAAAGRQLVADAEEARAGRWGPPRAYDDWRSLAWARLALGSGWDPAAAGASAQVARDLSWEALVAGLGRKRDGWALQSRVMASLALLGTDAANPSPRAVADTVADVTAGLRTQGRTAYVAADAEGAASAAPLDAQALALLLLLRAGEQHPLLPKLAAHVANPAAPTAGRALFCAPPSWAAAGLAAAALAEYDRARGSADPDVNVTAAANGMTVLKASFRAGGPAAPVSNSTPWEALPPAPAAPGGGVGSLSFQALGRGEVSAVASARFVPSALLPFPAYRGLYVEGALRALDPATGRPTGRPLSGVPLGAMVAYTLQLTSPDDLGPVTLSVLMPGGLEAVDPNLASGSDTPATQPFAPSMTDMAVKMGGVRPAVGMADAAVGFSGAAAMPRYGGGMAPMGPQTCDAASLGDVPWASWHGWYAPVCPAQETRPSVVTFRYASLRAGTSSVTLTAVAATAGTWVLPPVVAAADAQPELSGSTAAGALTVCAACAGPTYGNPAPPPKACAKDCSGNGVCNLSNGKCICNVGFRGPACGIREAE